MKSRNPAISLLYDLFVAVELTCFAKVAEGDAALIVPKEKNL
jgi:hypothetical protein